MKKLLSVLICMLMIVSCMTLIAPAEESEEVARLAVSDGSTLEGWSNYSKADSGIPAAVINTEIDPDGKGAVAVTMVGEVYANGGYKNPAGNGVTPTNGFMLAYQVAKDTVAGVQSYDLTGMSYLVFDMYVSDAAALGATEFYFELTSSGKPDVQERSWRKTLPQLKGSALTDGWNHFEIALDSYTTEKEPVLNMSAWNFFRVYNATAIQAGEGVTVAFKNLGFTAGATQGDGSGAESYAPVDGVISLPLFGFTDYINEKLPAANMRTDLDESGEAAWVIEYSGTVYKNGGYGAPEGATGWKFGYIAPTPIDISSMKYVVFDFYVSNATYVNDLNFQIELNSHPSAKIDMEENNLKTNFTAACGRLVNGWNHVELPLDSFNQGTGNDKPIAMDPTRWTFMRLYTTDVLELGEDTLTVAYKNFGFTETSSGGPGEADTQTVEAAEAVIALYEAVADITAGKVNADNYETVKAQLAAAIDAYNAANGEVQMLVDEALNVAKIERAVGRALEQYENEKDAPADPTDPQQPTDPSDPVDPADPTDPEQPGDEGQGGLNPVVIIVIAIAVLAVVAVVIIVAKKKK